jgi:hypothetical protein
MEHIGKAILGMVVVTAGLGACTAEPISGDPSAPSVTDVGVESQDEGASYDGWTQQPGMTFDCSTYQWWIYHWFWRSYGDASRGGGACFVRQTLTSCSSDSSCTVDAKGTYGDSAYGYCYQGTCYHRPGGVELCAQNPNNIAGSDGTASTWKLMPYGTIQGAGEALLGCMTKTAGLNSACGSQNSSLYMRTLMPASYDAQCW